VEVRIDFSKIGRAQALGQSNVKGFCRDGIVWVVDRRVNRIAPLSAHANPCKHVILQRAIPAVPSVQCSLVDSRD
jgi:hypothetical protein